jgi:hypothetical protein
MSTAAMMKPIAESSPRFKARIAGVFYLVTFVAGVFALVFGRRLGVVYFYAANLIATACYVAVTLLFYDLFKPVSRGLSLLAAFISLAGLVMGTLSLLHLAPSPINNLVFFGFYCLLIGYLIFRSTFLPRALGALMAFGGLGWLILCHRRSQSLCPPTTSSPAFSAKDCSPCGSSYSA